MFCCCCLPLRLSSSCHAELKVLSKMNKFHLIIGVLFCFKTETVSSSIMSSMHQHLQCIHLTTHEKHLQDFMTLNHKQCTNSWMTLMATCNHDIQNNSFSKIKMHPLEKYPRKISNPKLRTPDCKIPGIWVSSKCKGGSLPRNFTS